SNWAIRPAPWNNGGKHRNSVAPAIGSVKRSTKALAWNEPMGKGLPAAHRSFDRSVQERCPDPADQPARPAIPFTGKIARAGVGQFHRHLRLLFRQGEHRTRYPGE